MENNNKKSENKKKEVAYQGPFADWTFKARTFILQKKSSKLSSKWIQTRSSTKNPLFYWDKELKKNRELRYSTNFDSPFVDEQDGTALLGPIRFKNGVLFTDETSLGLQRFLLLHPKYDKIWSVIDKEADAVDELAILDMEYEAVKISREADLELIESVLRYNLKGKVDQMTTAELRKDAQLMAKRQPKLFLELASDNDLILRNLAVKAVDMGILLISQDGNKVTWGDTGKKVVDVGFDENPYTKLSQFFKRDEGIDLMKTIQAKLKQ